MGAIPEKSDLGEYAEFVEFSKKIHINYIKTGLKNYKYRGY
jgi:hypothetical protein